MRLIHRYLLRELLVNAVISLVVVFAIFFLAALSIQVGRSSSENLPMLAILKYVSLILLYTAYLTVPVCVVTTARSRRRRRAASASTGSSLRPCFSARARCSFSRCCRTG